MRNILPQSIVAVSLALACASLAAFVAVPQSITHDPSLLFLSRAKALGASYSAFALNSSVADLPAFRLSLDAKFQPMQRTQFDGLMAAYSFGATKSRVSFNASSSYLFTDFLPPLLQALNSLHFHTQYRNFTLPDVITREQSPAKCQRAQLSINCWGFVYDALLTSQSLKPFFTLSLAHSQVAWSALTDPATSLLLLSSNSTPEFFSNESARNSGLRPGDYFLIHHSSPDGEFLDHAVLYLDRDVFFERAGAGDNVPFRVTSWPALSSVWQPGVFDYSVRRRLQQFAEQGTAFGLHNDVTLQQLPELRDWATDAVARVFAASPEFADSNHSVVNGNAYVWIADTADLEFDAATGRAALPDSSFNPDNLQPRNVSAC